MLNFFFWWTGNFFCDNPIMANATKAPTGGLPDCAAQRRGQKWAGAPCCPSQSRTVHALLVEPWESPTPWAMRPVHFKIWEAPAPPPL